MPQVPLINDISENKKSKIVFVKSNKNSRILIRWKNETLLWFSESMSSIYF